MWVGRYAALVEIVKRNLDSGDAVEQSGVQRDELGARRVALGKPLELHQRHGRSYLIEAVVQAVLQHVVAVGVASVTVPRQRRHPVRAEEAGAGGDLSVSRDEHPALADRHVLVREEAEAPNYAEGSARLAADRSAWCVRGVFDQDEVATLG